MAISLCGDHCYRIGNITSTYLLPVRQRQWRRLKNDETITTIEIQKIMRNQRLDHILEKSRGASVKIIIHSMLFALPHDAPHNVGNHLALLEGGTGGDGIQALHVRRIVELRDLLETKSVSKFGYFLGI